MDLFNHDDAHFFGESGQVTAPRPYRDADRLSVTQILSWGDIQQSRTSPAGTMFANTGRKLYVIGDIDGGFRPRSNPYDLYTFGAPLPTDPLASKLQGVWAQPVKALNGYTFVVQANGEIWPLLDAAAFTQTFTEAQFDFQRGSLTATRGDFVAEDRPVLFTTLKLRNTSDQAIKLHVSFLAYFDLEDAWFTSLAAQRNQGETVMVKAGRLVATANSASDKWAVVVGEDRLDANASVISSPDGHPVGRLVFTDTLEPGSELTWTVGIAVEGKSGFEGAAQNLSDWLPHRETLLSEKRALYETLLVSGPRLRSPDPKFDMAFEVGRANLQMLEAETPVLGRYFYAGLETFPFWFSVDGAYSGPGLLATGLVAPTLNHLRTAAHYSQEGRIPHQISPSGDIVGRGNVQESPQWVVALWEAYCWTGDRLFLEEMYPAALESLFAYTLGKNNLDGDGYPCGPGIVERDDMGEKKLDSAVYTWAALKALAQMAEVLGDKASADRARSQADQLTADFDANWWDTANGTYVMSLSRTNRQMPVPHWAVIIPLEVGLAKPERAATTFASLQAQYINQWGLKHTAGDDERVWTLPTALLSKAAYRYGEPEMGFEMLHHLVQALDHGSIGMFHELIPEGLCFIQLWSGAEFVRGVVEDLLGIQVRADLHAVTITPQLPGGWEYAALENLTFGGHTLSVSLSREGATLTHAHGPAALSITYRARGVAETIQALEPGTTVVIKNR